MGRVGMPVRISHPFLVVNVAFGGLRCNPAVANLVEIDLETEEPRT